MLLQWMLISRQSSSKNCFRQYYGNYRELCLMTRAMRGMRYLVDGILRGRAPAPLNS